MRTILAPIQGYQSDEAVLDSALDLAGKFGSHVTALLSAPRPFVPIMHGVPTVNVASVIANMEAQVQSMKRMATKMAADIAARRGVHLGAVTGSDTNPSMELVIEDGDETAIVTRHAATNDLVVFDRGAFEDGLFVTRALVKDVLEDSGRPLLLTSGRIASTFPTSAAIAWSGSTEGARAVTAALPFLVKAEKVSILTAATSRTDLTLGPRLAAYLSRHGIAAQTCAVPHVENSAGQALHEAALGVSADLLVMGGFTRSRLRQTFFGGVTSSLLANFRGAIFIAH